MKKTSRRGHSTLNELNITPLLDLVFVLLVIFIITTPQMVNTLEMALPAAKPPPANPNAPKPRINHIVVGEKGEVFLNDAVVPDGQLMDRLRSLKAGDPDPKIVVKGADNVEYQSMIKVLDALQQLEITKIGLATQAGS
ncbi:MAG: ExbD/TolR family protein [Limisphaerales bacterium]